MAVPFETIVAEALVGKTECSLGRLKRADHLEPNHQPDDLKSEEDEAASVHVPSFSEQECWELAAEFVKRFSKGFLRGVAVYAGVKTVTTLPRNSIRKR